MSKSIDISNLLSKWHDAKEEISVLEEKCERYKKTADEYMKINNTNKITSEYFSLQRKKITKNTVSKTTLPKHIWDQYSKSSSYTAYYLTENK
jgi:hypothetical protein|uniref:Uncharacterized protein n=1 Tax=viral metagenome TaxID=1070528 RepID=A0A6C0D284_9ZZZZ